MCTIGESGTITKNISICAVHEVVNYHFEFSIFVIPTITGMIRLKEILDLSVAERILMIEKIWDSIDHHDIKLSAAQEQELDRRLERYEKGETTFVSWNDIKNELNSAK